MRRHPLASCGTKTRWASYALAERQAKKMRRKGKGRLAPYHCTLCKGFHVGEQFFREKEME